MTDQDRAQTRMRTATIWAAMLIFVPKKMKQSFCSSPIWILKIQTQPHAPGTLSYHPHIAEQGFAGSEHSRYFAFETTERQADALRETDLTKFGGSLRKHERARKGEHCDQTIYFILPKQHSCWACKTKIVWNIDRWFKTEENLKSQQNEDERTRYSDLEAED